MKKVLYWNNPTKKWNKSAPYLQQKCAYWSLNMVFLNKFVPKSTIRRCSSGINFFDYDDKFAINIMKI